MTRIPTENSDRSQRVFLVVLLSLVAAALASVGLASIAQPEVASPSIQSESVGPTSNTPTPATLLHTQPADLYVGPVARGTGDGSDEANAAAVTDIDDLIANVGPGGVIELVQSQGDFVIASPLYIRHGGEAGNPVTIRGPVTGPRPRLVGERSDPYTPDGNPGKPLFRLEQGADHLLFANLACERFGNGCFLINAPVAELEITSITAANVQRFFETGTAASGKPSTVSGLTIDQVEITGFSKGAIRLGHDTNNVVISDVVGDSLSQDGDNFAIGVHLVDTVHDVLLERVSMNNTLDTIHPYWNGDGFAVEESVYDIRLVDTSASGNSDAGYDIKASNVVLTGVFASGNKRNYRLSGHEIVLMDCAGVSPLLRGGTGTQAQIHASGNAVVDVVNCEFVDSSASTIVFDLDERSRMTVTGGSISFGEGAVAATVETGATLDIQTDGASLP